MPVSVPSRPAVHKGGSWLTGDCYRYTEEYSIPGYEIKYLGYTPFTPPDVFDFVIEEYQPLVYLVIDGHSRHVNCGRLKNCLRRHKPVERKGLTKITSIETWGDYR